MYFISASCNLVVLKQCSNLHKNVKAATNKIHTLGFGSIKEWRRKTFSKIHPLGFGRIKEWRKKTFSKPFVTC